MWTLGERYVITEGRPPKSGGMADVYQALDTHSDGRKVAVKLFKGELDGNSIFALAYDKEYRALSRLSHPHIVKWLDGGVDEKTRRRYFVMDWLEGCLEDRLATLRCEGWDSFYSDVGRDVLDALVYAYSRHILHRDVKPANVMFDADGRVQLVDFSIAKIKEYFVGGRTLADFRTVPYAPPEADSGVFTDSRDVFGWAALAVACIASQSLHTYDELNDCLGEADVPPDIYELLVRCLSSAPEDRPQNIVELAGLLEPIMDSRLKAQTPRRTVYFTLSPLARGRIAAVAAGSSSAEDFVQADLSEGCSARPLLSRRTEDGRPQPVTPGLEVISARLRYRFVVDAGALTMINAIPVEFSRDQRLLDDEFQPLVDFKPGVPLARESGASIIQSLLEDIEEFALRKRERDQAEQAERPFRIWDAVLKAKTELDRLVEAPLRFTAIHRDGARARLAMSGDVSGTSVGQTRLVRIGGRVVGGGEIERIADGTLVLLLQGGVDAIPNRPGELVLDQRASRAAIRRQREALESFRLDKSAKAGARQLLIDPSTAAVPMHDDRLASKLADLDADKAEAVIKALGSRDCFVVQGPPGTGKTRFISETIAQLIGRNPQSRVLLTAQTHIAVDNALTQLRRRVPGANCIRIVGTQSAARVAAESEDIVLANKARYWVKAVEEKADGFLSDWAIRQGLRAQDIASGLAVSRFRLAKRQFDDAASLCQKLEAQMAELPETSQTTESSEAPSRDEVAADLLTAEKRRNEFRRTLSEQRKILRNVDDSLPDDTDEELEQWETAFLGDDEASRQCKRVLQIVEDWRLRLENAPDFYAALMAEAQVIGGTCIGVASAPGIDSMEFDVAIIDEASKATVTEAMVPLERARAWIIVGDSRQLPPFVDAGLAHPELLHRFDLRREELSETLLSRFEQHLPSQCVVSLTHQRRMVREIGELVSRCFYDGTLQHLAEHDVSWMTLMLPKPVTWLSTSRLHNRHEGQAGRSYFNGLEGTVIDGFLRGLNRIALNADRRLHVGVLSGYVAQKAYLDRCLNTAAQECTALDIEINTIDAFQGREVDVGIYSVTRSNARGALGFLSEDTRLNVALSRARLGLVIVGDMEFLQGAEGENPFLRVLQHIEGTPSDCRIEVRVP